MVIDTPEAAVTPSRACGLNRTGQGARRKGRHHQDLHRRGIHEIVHQSYQEYSYAKVIRNFNYDVREMEVVLSPCACLHNYN